MNRISALIKETPERPPAPSAMWGHSEKVAIYESGSGLSPDTKSSGTLILDFPASRMERDKCLLFISCLVYGILLYSPDQLRQPLMSLVRERFLQAGDKWNERSQRMGIWGLAVFIHSFLPFVWDLAHDSRAEACDPELAIYPNQIPLTIAINSEVGMCPILG